MTHCATRGVPNDHQAFLKDSEANDSFLSVVLSLVFNFGSQSVEDMYCILEVKATIGQGPVALDRVVGDAHRISVYTKMTPGKRRRNREGQVS